MAKSRAPRRPLWLITNHENGRMGVFTLDPDREILPVFSFREEAEAFLRLGEMKTGWGARETTTGELISLLYGPCSGVQKVALDPLPTVDGEVAFDLTVWGRRAFLRHLAGTSPVHERRTEAIVGPNLVESPDGKGASSRENREEYGRTENDAARRKLERTPFGENGAAAIPDYVMRDFGSTEEAGESLA